MPSVGVSPWREREVYIALASRSYIMEPRRDLKRQGAIIRVVRVRGSRVSSGVGNGEGRPGSFVRGQANCMLHMIHMRMLEREMGSVKLEGSRAESWGRGSS